MLDIFRQEAFMEHYFTAQRDNIFRNVEVLIYVFDVESKDIEKDIHYYQSCLESMAQVFISLQFQFKFIQNFNQITISIRRKLKYFA